MILGMWRRVGVTVLAAGMAAGVGAGAQQQDKPEKPERHGRKYKKLEPAAKITIIVEKAANGKPVEGAGVVFKATTKDGHDEGGLEIKTDPDGHAMLDVIEVGSHVKVQVIAYGYSTAAVEFDVPTDEKEVVVKMEKPKAQISTYEDNAGKTSQRAPGVQEPPHYEKKKTVKAAPAVAAPGTASPAMAPTVAPPIGPATVPSPEAAPAVPAAGTPGGAGTPPATAPATSAPADTAPKAPQMALQTGFLR